MELLKIKDFKPEVKTIAQRLNIDEVTVEESLDRLERFGFLALEGKDYVLSKPNNTWVSHTATSEARRHLQKTLLQKSIVALETVPIERRHHSSYTFAIASEKLPELKEKIHELTLAMGGVASQSPELDEVYQFTVSLYPLTNFKEQI